MQSPEFIKRLRNKLNIQTLRPMNWDPIDVETRTDQDTLAKLYHHVEANWSQLGRTEPYFSVLTDKKFKSANVAKSIDQFYMSAALDILNLEKTLSRNKIDLCSFETCLEFGCGLGRVTTKLAKLFPHVTAADISAPHLEIAQRVLRDKSIDNVHLIHLSSISRLHELPSFDLFYSLIVLQHNPPPVIGYILRSLLPRLRKGGVAYFQIPTYAQGYRFSTREYLTHSINTPGIEMHVFPQRDLFELAADLDFEVLEVREDGATGSANWLSNTFLLRRRP